LASDGDTAIAVPSLGSFLPGYLLAIPITHVNASCGIPEAKRARFAAFVGGLASRLSSLYGTEVTMFEHGACITDRQPQSACINHAHVHLVPGSYNLMSEMPALICKHDSLQGFLAEEWDNPYLMLQDPGESIVGSEDALTSQFFRRIIAHRLGMSDCWDYAMFPFWENIKRTYLDFGIDVS
jgi:diadenosine tetraphosphate (Ap4A) HIT family hydrolase